MAAGLYKRSPLERPGRATAMCATFQRGNAGCGATIPHPIYAVSPDGRWAVAPDFRRLGDMRPGYGYNGIPDPYADQLAPQEAGIWRIDLETGSSRLLLSFAQIAKVPFPYCDATGTPVMPPPRRPISGRPSIGSTTCWSVPTARVSSSCTAGKRLHPRVGRRGMFTAAPDGSDLRVVDDCGVTSHFIWRDPRHILAWSLYEKPGGFFVFEDRTHGTPKKC